MGKRIRMPAVIFSSAVLIFSLSLTGCKKEEQQETKVITKSEGQMEGTLVSFEGKTLVIETADKEYTFDVSNASIDTKNMRSGDELVVYFEGKLKGQDTSNVKATSIEDLGQNEHQTEKQAVGTLVALTENTITIRQNDGVELLFSSNNCQHELKNGIREGNWIVVTYIGNINGTDTKNVTVIKITDNDPNVVTKEQKKMNIKAVDETVYATAGVHIRESYTTDSKVLGVLAKGGSITRTGVCENGWSRVQYESKDAYIYGEYLTTEKPASDAPAAKTNGEPPATAQVGNEPKPVVKQPAAPQLAEPQPQEQQSEEPQPQEQRPEEPRPAEEKPEPAEEKPEEPQPEEAQPEEIQPEESQPEEIQPEEPQPQEPQPQEPQPEEPQTIEGAVLEVSMNTLTIAADEQEYTLYIADAEHEYANGIQTGNIVKITYTGSLEDLENLIVIKVQDSDPNEAAKDAQYVGTVIDATMNTLTIQTEDGAVMTFIKEDAVNNLDGEYVGMNVKIIADMTESEADENIFQAKQIDPADTEQ